MIYARALLWLNSVVFVLYGVGFALFPESASQFVTGSAPLSTSGLIDMRATYGGLCLAAGVVFALLARDAATIRTGLVVLVIVIGGMAASRALGFFLDGSPNTLMVLYLATEVLVLLLAIWALRLLPAESAPDK
jgi:uncharacterized protein YjeT (DUF2065 family)